MFQQTDQLDGGFYDTEIQAWRASYLKGIFPDHLHKRIYVFAENQNVEVTRVLKPEIKTGTVEITG